MKIGIIKGYKPSSFSTQHFAQLEEVEGGFKIINAFDSCRTWMSDALYDIKTGKNQAIHKIQSKTFNHSKGPTHLGITFVDTKMKEIFIKNMNFIHEKEAIAKVRKTTLMATEHPLTMIITGSKFWKDSVWKIQLYTMYLRMMCYINLDYYKGYWKDMKKEINEPIMLSKLKIKKEVFTSMTNGVHGSTGPYAICTGQNPDMAKLLGVKTS